MDNLEKVLFGEISRLPLTDDFDELFAELGYDDGLVYDAITRGDPPFDQLPPYRWIGAGVLGDGRFVGGLGREAGDPLDVLFPADRFDRLRTSEKTHRLQLEVWRRVRHERHSLLNFFLMPSKELGDWAWAYVQAISVNDLIAEFRAKPRQCACGCGEILDGRKRKYLNATHAARVRQRRHRARQE
jgi:hypothetical protein